MQCTAVAAEDRFLSISGMCGRDRGGVSVEGLGEVDRERNNGDYKMDHMQG
jgi:hypothetical protein